MSSDENEHGHIVRQMFTRIADRYDLLNRLMTLGQDRRWREETVEIACSENPTRILDLGTGTGDLALEAYSQYPQASVVALDFTPEMMTLGRRKRNGDQILWVVADSQDLPFPNSTFDASISGFLVRNLHNLDQVLREQFRVLIPTGRVVSLDTTPPGRSLVKPILMFYLNLIIPLFGRIFAQDQAAYQYLRDTTKQFLSTTELEQKNRDAGFIDVHAYKRMFGIIAIHSGQKPDF